MFNSFETKPVFSENEQIERNPILDIAEKIDSYIAFLNSMDSDEKITLASKFEFDYKEAEKTVENDLLKTLEAINEKFKEGGLKIISESSFQDIVGNSILTEMKFADKISARIANKGIGEMDEKDNADMRLAFSNLRRSFEDIVYYLNELCTNEEKMKMELERKHGLLEKYENYFIKEEHLRNGKTVEEASYPGGMKKISYIRFFDGIEKGKINEINWQKEARKLPFNKKLYLDEKRFGDIFRKRRG